jgi:predicted nucleic acid-binding Zn ribbon protein
MKRWIKQIYGFIFYRCYVCGKRIAKQDEYCSKECADAAFEKQANRGL